MVFKSSLNNGGGGGGGSPASPSGSVQYNNAGAFGGFGSWDGTNLKINGGSTPGGAQSGISIGNINEGLSNLALTTDSGSGAAITVTGNVNQHLEISVSGSETCTVTPTGLGVYNHDPAYPLDVEGDAKVGGGAPGGTTALRIINDGGNNLGQSAELWLDTINQEANVGFPSFRIVAQNQDGGGNNPAYANVLFNAGFYTSETTSFGIFGTFSLFCFVQGMDMNSPNIPSSPAGWIQSTKTDGTAIWLAYYQ